MSIAKSFELTELLVRSATFAGCRIWVVSGADDKFICVYNCNTMHKIEVFEAHTANVRSVAVHPVLSSSDDMLKKPWDWEKGWMSTQIFQGHFNYIMQMTFNLRDTNTVACASLDCIIKIWNLGCPDSYVALHAHQKGVTSVDCFTCGDKTYLITGSDIDQTAKVWDYQNKCFVQMLEGHTHHVSAVCFHPKLPIIITGSEDGVVCFWNATIYRLKTTLNYGLENVWADEYMTGSCRIVIGYAGGTIMVKIRREEPVASMDNSGKIIFIKQNEIQTVNIKSVGVDFEASDGERLPLAVKVLGNCDIHPQRKPDQSRREKALDLHPTKPWILYILPIFLFSMVSAYSEIAPYSCQMAAADPKVAHEFCPNLLIYNNGCVKRFEAYGKQFIPPSLDKKTNVQSKDIVYAHKTNLTARIFLPKSTKKNQRIPLLVYYHGGGFAYESPFSVGYHSYLNTLVASTKVIGVSVYYRLAPENPLPCAHDDSWEALKWVAAHVNRTGPEDWLNHHADFQRVFIYGDSAGANLAHNMGMRNGVEKLQDVKVVGIILSMPFFWGNKPLDGEKNDPATIAKTIELLQVVYPATRQYDVPLLNPAADRNLVKLGCTKVLDFTAGLDFLKFRGRYYYDKLRKSQWRGKVEIVEFPGEHHGFNLANPHGQNAKAMLKKIDLFINQEGIICLF